jgi:hypothetical protein
MERGKVEHPGTLKLPGWKAAVGVRALAVLSAVPVAAQ